MSISDETKTLLLLKAAFLVSKGLEVEDNIIQDLVYDLYNLMFVEIDDEVGLETRNWCARDGADDYEDVLGRTAYEAAKEVFYTGHWSEPSNTTEWVHIRVYKERYTLTDEGELTVEYFDDETHKFELDPEPFCRSEYCSPDEHVWARPFEVVGGIKENPGVWGHGGGAVYREVCKHCGMYRVTNTWAQDPVDGEQGLTSVTYEHADDESLEWVNGMRLTSDTEPSG